MLLCLLCPLKQLGTNEYKCHIELLKNISRKIRHLSEVEVTKAVALIENGSRFRYTARIVSISYSVILKLWNRSRRLESYVAELVNGENVNQLCGKTVS